MRGFEGACWVLSLTDQCIALEGYETKIQRFMLGLKASKLPELSEKWKYKVLRFVDCACHCALTVILRLAEEAEEEVRIAGSTRDGGMP